MNKKIELPKDKPKKQRYNETEVIKKYLKSEKGIPFLLNSTKYLSEKSENQYVKQLFKRDVEVETDELYRKADELIDFYLTWTHNFPVRKNLKVSKYEFLKSVEDFCWKPEIASDLSSIIKK